MKTSWSIYSLFLFRPQPNMPQSNLPGCTRNITFRTVNEPRAPAQNAIVVYTFPGHPAHPSPTKQYERPPTQEELEARELEEQRAMEAWADGVWV